MMELTFFHANFLHIVFSPKKMFVRCLCRSKLSKEGETRKAVFKFSINQPPSTRFRKPFLQSVGSLKNVREKVG